MKTSMIKILAATATILMATSLVACSKSEAQQTTAQNSVQAPVVRAAVTEATASFTIEKMTCATCPISVRKAMKRVDGVKSVKVDFKTKIATVIYDSALTTPAQIAAASTGVGYPANEIIG